MAQMISKHHTLMELMEANKDDDDTNSTNADHSGPAKIKMYHLFPQRLLLALSCHNSAFPNLMETF